MKKRLIDVPCYHLFGFPNDPFDKLYLLNEAHIDKESGRVQFEWHRVYWRDGRTNLNGKCTFDRAWLESTEVIDRGDYYEWMKVNHPIRYKRENWEASRPKEEQERMD